MTNILAQNYSNLVRICLIDQSHIVGLVKEYGNTPAFTNETCSSVLRNCHLDQSEVLIVELGKEWNPARRPMTHTHHHFQQCDDQTCFMHDEKKVSVKKLFI